MIYKQGGHTFTNKYVEWNFFSSAGKWVGGLGTHQQISKEMSRAFGKRAEHEIPKSNNIL